MSCAACGMTLPPPAARAWHLMRGTGQFGPYTVAELQAYVAEGRILPTDNVWHDGASVRITVRQLPPQTGAAPTPAPVSVQPQAAQPAPLTAAPAAATPASAPVAPQPVAAAPQQGAAAGDRIKLHVGRAFNWNLRALPVEESEETKLLANGVDEVDARRYLVWRRSVLLVVALPTLLSALLATFSRFSDDAQYSGVGNILEILRLAALFALPVTAWWAAAAWDNHRRSRNILLRGWLFAFLTPLLVALVPFGWRYNFQASNATELSNANAAFGFIGAMIIYVTLMPAVLSLIPGVVRACLRIKALIPESILPGLFLVAATPLYLLLFLVIFTTVNQAAGNMLLIFAVFALLAAPLLYLFNARLFMRPLRTEEDMARIGSVQKTATIVLGIGLALLVIYAFTATIFGRPLVGLDENTSLIRPWNPSLIQFPIDYIVRSLFTTVLVADLFMLMNLALWRHTKEFQASPDAASYDRLMVEIEEAGGTPQPVAGTTAA